ncbi:hypothetical protein BV22DRAFT_1040797 [Leucogyrophana mollusca]|uniref:Uncharacterized protein n=1 Tax=Leucogyrophana mollusca TaxID=85980 RepID=A0ACB8B1J8_9AGAM|nr:hypothetical protein BV22DRAFT_1040797 [Leucogyrophana mollusca]
MDVAGRSQGPRVQLPGWYLRDVLTRPTSTIVVLMLMTYLNVVVLCGSVQVGPK